jgi:hypothetical protein
MARVLALGSWSVKKVKTRAVALVGDDGGQAEATAS